jgi:hypothetical protein
VVAELTVVFQPPPSEDIAPSSNFAPGAEGYHFGRQAGVGQLSGLAQQQTGKLNHLKSNLAKIQWGQSIKPAASRRSEPVVEHIPLRADRQFIFEMSFPAFCNARFADHVPDMSLCSMQDASMMDSIPEESKALLNTAEASAHVDRPNLHGTIPCTRQHLSLYGHRLQQENGNYAD